jgi:Na+/citrate or Na+/malate symporter
MPYLSLGMLALVISILAIYTIWRYDNRSLQIQLSSISMLLATVLMGMIVYFCTKSPRLQLSAITGTYQLGFYIPALVVLCNLLAKHFIQKDEKFIQSTNRLR